MAKVDLVLSVHPSGWHKGSAHGGETDRDKAVRGIYDKVMKRDDYTCQGCGWRSERYQQIHPRDHNHRHMELKNVDCLCPFCHQVFHLNTASSGGGGDLIWLPEISQATLNLMVIPMFVALRSKSRNKHPGFKPAKQLEGLLNGRLALLRNIFPQADAGYIAEDLLELSPEAYAKRNERLRHIRLMPRAERFSAEIDYWATLFPEESAWPAALPADLDISALMQGGTAA